MQISLNHFSTQTIHLNITPFLQVIRPLLSPGVLAVLLLVFLECVVVVLTVLARVHLATCVVGGVCLLPPGSGAAGIAKLM